MYEQQNERKESISFIDPRTILFYWWYSWSWENCHARISIIEVIISNVWLRLFSGIRKQHSSLCMSKQLKMKMLRACIVYVQESMYLCVCNILFCNPDMSYKNLTHNLNKQTNPDRKLPHLHVPTPIGQKWILQWTPKNKRKKGWVSELFDYNLQQTTLQHWHSSKSERACKQFDS